MHEEKNMIRALTLIENTKEDGSVEYTTMGSLPIDEAAKALVVVAYQTIPAKKEDISGQIEE